MAKRVKAITGQNETGRFGLAATDLGAMCTMSNGEVLTIFGDSFSGKRVGEGDWRSPAGLIGMIGSDGFPAYTRAAGTDPKYARQLLPYDHNNPEFSTKLPSDVICLPDGRLVMHVMVNKGLGNVIRTELWYSDDLAQTWHNSNVVLEPWWDGGKRQLWTFDYSPYDKHVYVMSTGFQRNKGIIMFRVHWTKMFDIAAYQPWTFKDNKWQWGVSGIDVPGEIWRGAAGELNLRIVDGKWVLTMFDAGAGQIISYLLKQGVTSNIPTMPKTVHARGSMWLLDGYFNFCAQLYGGYVVPQSKLDTNGGVKIKISQWNTATNFPYRVLGYESRLDK